ncbi:MAG: hypothetical protein KBG62_06555 [Propionivibrio sp.]|nr:hypothetical protein [Propionivibrio sp.]
MNFSQVAERFAQSGAGTDDFKRLYKEAFELMKSDSPHAALYFVIGSIAHAYVIQYEDQGVSTEFADKAKGFLVDFNQKICQALTADTATKLALLGEIATQYQFDIPEF